MIYHITTFSRWKTAVTQGIYEADSLEKEGFIHASNEGQIKGVLQRYYQGQTGLVLLHIDESKLTAKLKYELSHSVNEEFPHIFGRLNINAVIKATSLW